VLPLLIFEVMPIVNLAHSSFFNIFSAACQILRTVNYFTLINRPVGYFAERERMARSSRNHG
jgi:hypothetical protein